MGKKPNVVIKVLLKTMAIKLLIVFLIVAMVSVFLSAITYWITIDDGTYDEDDWGSTPYAASTYTGGVTVQTDGTITSDTTVQELWDQMEINGSRVANYLSSPEELSRLMRAEIVTQYPDTRNNPDEPIDWQDIIENEDKLQGIIKFKRADTDNN